MSRTRRREGGVTSPIKLSIVCKPNSGTFEIYNKETKEKQEDIESISIIILDADRFSLTGFSPEYDTGYVTNLVHNSKEEPFTVGVFINGKYKKIEEGLYQDIKENLEGVKYTKNVIGLVKEDGEWVLADLQLIGQPRTIFQDWYIKNNPDGLVTISFSKEVYSFNKKTQELDEVPEDKQKKWQTTWLHKPEFKDGKLDKADATFADEKDFELQDYFDAISGKNKSKSKASASNDAPTAEDDDDDLPF